MALVLGFILDESTTTDLFDIDGTPYGSYDGLTHRFVAVEDDNTDIGTKIFVQEVFQLEDMAAAMASYVPAVTTTTTTTTEKKSPKKKKKTDSKYDTKVTTPE